MYCKCDSFVRIVCRNVVCRMVRPSICFTYLKGMLCERSRRTQVRLMRDTSVAHEPCKRGSYGGVEEGLYSLGFFVQQLAGSDVELLGEAAGKIFRIVEADFVGYLGDAGIFLSAMLQEEVASQIQSIVADELAC